ncbi:hypothetical protein LTR36_005292 [Oleoguttula mirabilis]|uniref:F-box domain-containing protein n=1 Tax=Oleoguttula mirabilis TaxID=1507867 RepID=A0AAV9JFF9_9PEZI|nr:hypothetical protein LTR36_005292 [Oleoguttula mirabilis]
MPPTLRKRKRSASPSPAPSPTPTLPQPLAQAATPPNPLRVFATQLKQNPNEVSLLLDLPAELRNTIYMMVLDDTEVLLARVRNMKALAAESALPRVNKQVRDEFLSTATLAANIHTTSIDFDFRHIVAFLNRLSDAELQALPSANIPNERKITVDLTISEGCAREPEFLQRWINRAGHPTKKGTNIDFQYKLAAGTSTIPVTPVRFHAGGTAQVAYLSMPKFPHWKGRFALMAGGRQKEEFGKIVVALGY